MAQIAAERYTGTSIKRSEDPRILTGRGRYIADVKLPGMLHAAFVRSPLAHARVLAVDASAARALPGVVAVFTGADLEAVTVPGPDPLLALMGGGGPMPEYTLLATDKGRFVGGPVTCQRSPCWRRTGCVSGATRGRTGSPRAVTWLRTAVNWSTSNMQTC